MIPESNLTVPLQATPLSLGRNKRHFTRLLGNLRRDLEPVGTLEEVLVEKMQKKSVDRDAAKALRGTRSIFRSPPWQLYTEDWGISVM